MTDEKIDDQLENKNVVIFAEGTELTVDVPSEQTVLNYKFESTLDWELKTDAEWLEIDPMSGKAGKDIKIQIKVLHNKDKEGRTGYADLTLSNDESYRITINQAGEGDENEDIVVDIPNNQIWYTSVNGEVVETYSGGYNNYADAHTTFGVNIVSNTYVDGKGVIEFDGDVTIIGQCAFYGCSSLTSVTIPDSVTTIGLGAFYFCDSLTSVTIPDSVTTIEDNVFTCCSSLTSVTIPDGVTTIGYAAFDDCSSLTSVTIPDSVTTIGYAAFDDCSSLTSVTIGDSVTTIGVWAFQACISLTSVTIPDSVTTIGDAAFSSCYSLTSVTIGDSVTTIGEEAFYYCSNLTSVTIPDSVTEIGERAFGDCRSLTSVTIGDSVTEIGDYAFSWCEGLASVTIGDSVTMIGDTAFGKCSNLQEFKGKFASEDGRCLIIDGVLNSFAPSGLTEYTIPDSVTTIGEWAFYGCSSLTIVTIPDIVTTIGYATFAYCENLNTVYCKTINPPTTIVNNDGYWFGFAKEDESGNICNIDCTIYVPTESVEAYKSAQGWSEYASDIVGYNF